MPKELLKDEIELIEGLFKDKGRLGRRSIQYNIEGGKRAEILIKEIIKHTKLHLNGLSILDLGSGLGHLSICISPKAKKIISVDINRKYFKLFKKRISLRRITNIYPIIADSLMLPFKDEMFDMVIAMDLYEHVKDQDRLVENMTKLVRKHRFVVITTGNKIFPYELHTLLWFITYMPQRLADKYVKFRVGRKKFDIYQPTYWGLRKKFRRMECIVTAEHIVEKSKEILDKKYSKLSPILKILVKSGILNLLSPNFLVVAKKII